MHVRQLSRTTRLVVGAVAVVAVGGVSALVAPLASAEAPCPPYSDLDCEVLTVDPTGDGFTLQFDGSEGGLGDATGEGTGFTLVQPSTTGDYLPDLIDVDSGALRITTTPGIQFSNPTLSANTNSLDNGLGVALPTPTAPLELTTTLAAPPAGSNKSEQAGLWLGTSEDDYVKLVVISFSGGNVRVQLATESGGESPSTSQINSTGFAPGALPVELTLTVDPVAGTVSGSFERDGVVTSLSPSLPLPDGIVDGLDPAVPGSDAGTTAGVFATERNRVDADGPLTYVFEDFGVTELPAPDVTPPAPPAALTATGTVDTVDLAWDASTDPEAVGYQVLRSTSSPVDTSGDPISGLTPLTGTTWSDDTVFLDDSWQYAVVAVDEAGNRSTAVEAGPAGPVAPAGDPVTRVDFLPDGMTPAEGHVADTGLGFDAARGFGWIAAADPAARTPLDLSANTRERSEVTPPRLATLIHLQYGDITPPGSNGVADEGAWEIAVDPGRYAVTVAAGDIEGGGGYDSLHQVNAEGVTVLGPFQGSEARQFDEATAEVEVTDGFLTLDATGGTNTKISYVEVTTLEAFDVTAPAAPTGVTATPGDVFADLAWTAPADTDVTTYRVYRGTGGAVDSTAPVAEVTAPATTVTDTGLTNGTEYTYAVTAVDGAGNESAASDPVSVTPEAPVDTTPPAAPTALTGSAGVDGISLSWTAPADPDVASYEVFRGTLGVADLSAPIATVTDPAYLDAAVDPGTTYTYAVTAVDADGNTSVPSDEIDVSTDPAEDVTAPPAPATLDATVAGTTVTLTWPAVVADDLDGYRVVQREETIGVGIWDDTVLGETDATTFDVTGLEAGRQYTFFVRALDTSGNASPESPLADVDVPTAAACDAGDGWVAEYFGNQTLTGPAAVTDCVPAVQFDYGTGSPDPSLADDGFSARFSRALEVPAAGVYRFSARADDGIRVFVDGVAVLDEWRDQGAQEQPFSVDVPLTAGVRQVVVEYYENGGGALVEASYQYVGPVGPCPAGQWVAEYFDGTDLAGGVVAEECVQTIDEDWGGSGPDAAPEVGDDGFSVRWTTTRTLPAGTYRFQANSDDGIRVSVDGDLVIDEWRDQGPAASPYTADVVLPAGEHVIVVEYYENGGGALARAGFSPLDAPACVDEWAAQYFDNVSLDGTPVKTDCDPAISFDYADGGPSGLPTDDFSARWTRDYTLTEAGVLVVTARADDGVRVFVNDVPVIDEWYDSGPDTLFQNEVALPAGEHTVRVEYYERGGGALIQATADVQPAAVECTADQWAAQYFDGKELAGAVAGSECLDAVDEDWAEGGPSAAPSVGVDDFSARFTRDLSLTEPGTYQVSATSDDGVRVFVNGTAVIDEWRDQGPQSDPFTGSIELPAGDHVVTVEYYEAGGGALLRVGEDVTPVTDLPPASPESLTAMVADGSVLLDWAAVSDDDLAGYRVFRSTASPVDLTGDPLSGTDPLSLTSFTDTTVEAGTTYHYAVVAVDLAGQVSAPSPEATALVEPTPDPVDEAWNFQPAAAPVPAGFTPDTGAAYTAAEGRGWVTQATAGSASPTPLNLTANTRDRNRSGIPQELDTLIHMQYGDIVPTPTSNGDITPGAWERDLPNGTYTVTVSAGDQGGGSNGYDSLHVLRAEGQVILPTFQGSAAEEYRTASADVLVDDGRLSVDAIGGSNTKINWITIETAGPDVTAPDPVGTVDAEAGDGEVLLSWEPSPSSDVAGYRVYRDIDLPIDVAGDGLSADLVTGTSFVDTTVTNGVTYYYGVVAVDAAGNVADTVESPGVTPQAFVAFDVSVDFGIEGMTPAVGHVLDHGQAYGPRLGTDQGSGLTYGWIEQGGSAPLSLVGNGRDRGRAGIEDRLDSILHMQYGDIPNGNNGIDAPGAWQIAVPDGVYEVTVAVGDEPGSGGVYDSTHAVNIEAVAGVVAFQASAADEYETTTQTVWVDDGALTISAIGGTNTKIAYAEITQVPDQPVVTTVRPLNRSTGFDVTDGIAADITTPLVGVGVDPASLTGDTVQLFEVGGGEVAGTQGSSGGNDVITFDPDADLDPFTQYRFVVDGALASDGSPFAPFTSVFTTGDDVITTPGTFTPVTGVSFEQVEQPVAAGQFISSMVFGPDGKLYASTIGAGIVRYTVAADGTLSDPESLAPSLLGRAIIGIVFDEAATAENLRLWVTHATANLSNESDQWGSKVTLLTGPTLGTANDVFVNLPRSQGDHLTNSIGYGPGGDLYVLQGSNQAAGDPDNSWGSRGEKLLTAALLRFDPNDPQVAAAAAGGTPIDVQTDDTATPYDPYGANAPLTLHATGIRNAYDFVFHSNGRVYVPTNGTAGGGNSPGVDVEYDGAGALVSATRLAAANTPTSASIDGQDLTDVCDARIDRLGQAGQPDEAFGLTDTPPIFNHPTQRDFLFDVVEDGYYGHPNPTRCEFVLNNGGLAEGAGTSGSKYPASQQPDPNYRGWAYDFQFNKSPNGVIEYQNATFDGQLQGRVVVVRFSNNNDLEFLQVDPATGDVLGAQTSNGITGVADSQIGGVDGFDDPLEVVEDPATGNLYVNQYDRGGSNQKLFLLRVPQDQRADAVSTDVDELIFSSTQSTTDGPETVLVTNDGSEDVTLSAAVEGPAAAAFTVTAGGSQTVAAGTTVPVEVTFDPSGAVGYQEAQLVLTGGGSSVEVGLYGLSAAGQFGGNEPTLANALLTLGHPTDVGWSGLAGGTDPDPVGDEVEVELFEKAGAGPVTMTPIAAYAPMEEIPFGWYEADGTLNEVGVLADGQQQTLLPALASGGTTFDPGDTEFGLYYFSNSFGRTGYTEDSRNDSGGLHRVRIYPATARDGSPIANAYILAFEDAANGDYQDYVFLLSGVVPAGTEPEPEPVGTVKVNFSSLAAPLPSAYLRDHGQAYGQRTGADQGGLTYGWVAPATGDPIDLSVGGNVPGNGRDRDLVDDQRLDTLMHMAPTDIPGGFNGTKADGTWELALPDGTYEVTVAAGDPSVGSDPEVHTLVVEGVTAVDGFVPSGTAGAASRSTTATVTVPVSDGALTVDGSAGTNTKIHYVDVVPVTVTPPGDQTVQVTFQTAGVPTPAGWVADAGLAYDEARGFGWLDDATGSPADRTDAARARGTSGAVDTTFNIVQNDVVGSIATTGRWEYALPDGSYLVELSAGDPDFGDSVHSLDVEGVEVLSEFLPTGPGDYQVADQLVTVADGRLTVTPGFNGTNTKIQWIRITGSGVGEDTVDPAVSVSVSGTAGPGGGFLDEALVTVTASDGGGSGLAGVTLSVDGGPAAPYTAPVTVTGPGPHTVTATATDGAGNTATATETFEIETIELGDGLLASENPEAAPFADRYVMSRTENDPADQNPKVSDSATVVLRNTGTEAVEVTAVDIVGGGFVLDPAPALPQSVAPGAALQVPVLFTATSGPQQNLVVEADLAVTSNAANGPTTTVELAGIVQDRPEGGTEPNVAEIAEAFGWGTTIVGPGQQINNDGVVETIGDEILAPYWERLDLTKPVTVRQLAAYHSCCNNTATFFTHAKGSNSTQSRLVHDGEWAQTLLPRINGSDVNPAVASFTPASQVFGIKIDPEWSDPDKNNIGPDQCPGLPPGQESDTCQLGHHVRVWPVEGRDGVAIPGLYLVVMDYSGINYDFNDNAYLVSNIVPEGEADTTPPAAPTGVTATLDGADGSVDVAWAGVTAPDLAGYHVERSTGGGWNRLTTTPVAGTAYSDATPPGGTTVQYRVLSVDVAGNVSDPSTAASVDTPAPAFAPIRVNTGGAAVTAGGLDWAADTGFTGGKSYTNTSVTAIGGTDADAVYLAERSATSNLGSFAYGFTVPSGDYTVRLHFAEIYWGATGGGPGGTGQRVFSVTAEGAPAVTDLDLNAVVPPMTAYVAEVPVTVTDGTLDLSFTASVNQPTISAVEVLEAP